MTYLVLLWGWPQKAVFHTKRPLDLKDLEFLVKDQKLNVFLSQKTPIQLFPLCSLLAGSGYSSSLVIYRALPTHLPKHFYYQTDVNPGHDSKVPFV